MTAVTATLSQVTGMDAGRVDFLLPPFELGLHLVGRSSDLDPPGMASCEFYWEGRHWLTCWLQDVRGFSQEFIVAALAPVDPPSCLSVTCGP
jgi:hypothetical protein